MVAVRIRDRGPPDTSAAEAEAVRLQIEGLLTGYLRMGDPKDLLERIRKSGHSCNLTQESLRLKDPSDAFLKRKGLKEAAAGVPVPHKHKGKHGKGPGLRKEESKSRFNTSSEEAEDSLKSVFSEYCSYGDPLNTVSMSSSKFMKLAKDAMLVREVGYAELDILFKKAARGLDDDANKLSFWEFVDLVGYVGQALLPALPPQEAYLAVEDKIASMAGYRLNVVVMGGGYAGASREDMARQAEVERLVLHPAIWAAINGALRPLRAVFEFYAATSVAGFGRSDAKMSSHIQKSFHTMEWDEFHRFATNFQLCPQIFSRGHLMQIFVAANAGEAADQDDTEMSFEEFCECLARMALVEDFKEHAAAASAPPPRRRPRSGAATPSASTVQSTSRSTFLAPTSAGRGGAALPAAGRADTVGEARDQLQAQWEAKPATPALHPRPSSVAASRGGSGRGGLSRHAARPADPSEPWAMTAPQEALRAAPAMGAARPGSAVSWRDPPHSHQWDLPEPSWGEGTSDRLPSRMGPRPGSSRAAGGDLGAASSEGSFADYSLGSAASAPSVGGMSAASGRSRQLYSQGSRRVGGGGASTSAGAGADASSRSLLSPALTGALRVEYTVHQDAWSGGKAAAPKVLRHEYILPVNPEDVRRAKLHQRRLEAHQRLERRIVRREQVEMAIGVGLPSEGGSKMHAWMAANSTAAWDRATTPKAEEVYAAQHGQRLPPPAWTSAPEGPRHSHGGARAASVPPGAAPEGYRGAPTPVPYGGAAGARGGSTCSGRPSSASRGSSQAQAIRGGRGRGRGSRPEHRRASTSTPGWRGDGQEGAIPEDSEYTSPRGEGRATYHGGGGSGGAGKPPLGRPWSAHHQQGRSPYGGGEEGGTAKELSPGGPGRPASASPAMPGGMLRVEFSGAGGGGRPPSGTSQRSVTSGGMPRGCYLKPQGQQA